MTSTGNDGTFDLPNVGMHTYVLNVSCIGYATINRIVRVEKPNQNLGELFMAQAIIQLGEVVIQGILPTAVQRADTTEFLAKAFKTNPDADAGDLIEKMPGIVISNGTITSNGETVQQILVDGKPFFGTDPTIALRSLPAEAIEKIQVFDKMSDQAEFTGFDDGQSVKTINIMLRPERRTSQFGKTYGGYADDGRYIRGGERQPPQRCHTNFFDRPFQRHQPAELHFARPPGSSQYHKSERGCLSGGCQWQKGWWWWGKEWRWRGEEVGAEADRQERVVAGCRLAAGPAASLSASKTASLKRIQSEQTIQIHGGKALRSTRATSSTRRITKILRT